MEKIRVGMIYHGEYPPHPRIENQALHLIEIGVDVILFCITYTKKDAGSTMYKGIKIIRNYYPSFVYRLSALAYSFPLYHWLLSKTISKFISSNNLDYLHIHNMFIAEVVFQQNKKIGFPVVFDIHENVPEIMKHYPHLKKRVGKILISPTKWKQKESEFIQKANSVIVVTEEAKQEIVKRLKIENTKIKVLPNFTNSSFIKEKYSDAIGIKFKDKFKVLYIGDTGVRRGLASVIKSVNYLKEIIPNLAIIIVGKSKDDANLFKLIKTENVEDFVFMEGWQSENSLSDYVHFSDVGICPILRNLHHDTTYANKLFQYAMHGKPILASDCPSQAELITKNKWGLIHNAGNPKDFADKLLSLYNNKASRIDFGENAKKSILDKYNFDSSNFNVSFYDNLKS